MAAGIVRSLLWARRGSRAIGARLLLAWTVGPVVVFSLGLMPIPTQYWTVLLPLPALYLALGLDGGGTWLARRVSPRAVVAGMAAVACVVALCWVGSYGALLAAVDAGAGARAFGVPLARWQQVLTATRESAVDLGTQEVRVAVDGVDPGYDSEPAAVAMLIGNPPWRVSSRRRSRLRCCSLTSTQPLSVGDRRPRYRSDPREGRGTGLAAAAG